MDNKNRHIIELITAHIGFIDQANQHFEETRVLSRWGYVPLKHVKKLYRWVAHYHAQIEKPSLLLLKILGQEVAHG